MRRRDLLVGAVSATLAVTAGCVERGPKTPEGMSVETHHVAGSHLEDPGIGPSGERPRATHAMIADRSEARDRLRDDEEIAAFVDGTDFDREYLLVVLAGSWPSDHELELREIARTDDGLEVSVVSVPPSGVSVDDAAVHSLTIRVTDDESDAPERVVLEVDGVQTNDAHRSALISSAVE